MRFLEAWGVFLLSLKRENAERERNDSVRGLLGYTHGKAGLDHRPGALVFQAFRKGRGWSQLSSLFLRARLSVPLIGI